MNKRIRINGKLYESVEDTKKTASEWEDEFNDLWENFRDLGKRIRRDLKKLEVTPEQKEYTKELVRHLDDVNFAMGDVGLDLQMLS